MTSSPQKPSAPAEQADQWGIARADWRRHAQTELDRLHDLLAEALPGELARDTIYAPMHDIAGIAGVFGYTLIGQIARRLTERLREGPTPLDAAMLKTSRAYLATVMALHAADVTGDGGEQGAAILDKLSAIKGA